MEIYTIKMIINKMLLIYIFKIYIYSYSIIILMKPADRLHAHTSQIQTHKHSFRTFCRWVT